MLLTETKRISLFTDVANLPLRSSLPVGCLAGEPLAGPPDWSVDTLAEFVADGFDTLVFWPVETEPAQVELLAGEVAPHLRASG